MVRVLQIEDMPSDAYLISREIKKTLGPCEFQIVEDKDAFLLSLIEFRPEIIISDFSIPGFDWKTALVLAIKHSPLTPFIIVTGSTSEEIRNQCINAGATDFISKNTIQELGPAVLKALKKGAV
ncbi:MAG: response regulator [Bacteroidetes bacterium]|nr:response regulator [Bacteroidota bacterium]